MKSYISKRTPVIHLLTTTPAEQAEFWVTIAHEVRMIGLSSLDFSRQNFAGRCDPCVGELLMVLPLTLTESVLQEAIPPVVDAWLPQWKNHIDLVCEMAVAMAKHRDEQQGVFQTFTHALKALPDMPPFQDEALMQAASARAVNLLEEREWEHGKLWCLRKVPRRELPWIFADASWEQQLDDAFTFLHIWRKTHFNGIEHLTENRPKPPALSCMPFVVGVLGLGRELEVNLRIIERYRLNRKQHLEQNLQLMLDMLRGLRSGWSPYELMLWASAAMPKPLDIDSVRRRIDKHREKTVTPNHAPIESSISPPAESKPFLSHDEVNSLLYEVLTPEEVESLSSPTLPTTTDRDINSYTQEEVDAMLADLPDEVIQAMVEMVAAIREGLESGELTPQEVAGLLANRGKPEHNSK